MPDKTKIYIYLQTQNKKKREIYQKEVLILDKKVSLKDKFKNDCIIYQGRPGTHSKFGQNWTERQNKDTILATKKPSIYIPLLAVFILSFFSLSVHPCSVSACSLSEQCKGTKKNKRGKFIICRTISK